MKGNVMARTLIVRTSTSVARRSQWTRALRSRCRTLRPLMAAIVITVLTTACGDGGDSADTSDIKRVLAGGQVTPGNACPAGATESYRTGDLLVCNTCDDNSDCQTGGPKTCNTICGPGCEDDTSGCCPVRLCQ